MTGESFDNYGQRNGSSLGLRYGSARNYTLDTAYTFSENPQTIAWFSRNETRIDQASRSWSPIGGSRKI